MYTVFVFTSKNTLKRLKSFLPNLKSQLCIKFSSFAQKKHFNFSSLNSIFLQVEDVYLKHSHLFIPRFIWVVQKFSVLRDIFVSFFFDRKWFFREEKSLEKGKVRLNEIQRFFPFAPLGLAEIWIFVVLLGINWNSELLARTVILGKINMIKHVRLEAKKLS